MSMNLDNVKEDAEIPIKVVWPNITAKGKQAVKKITSALANQTSEENFKKEIMEALAPVFNEVYLLVKTNVVGFEEFLDQFPVLHDMKNPVWANMFEALPFNAENNDFSILHKQLTEMEVRMKALGQSIPTTQDFIKVILRCESIKY